MRESAPTLLNGLPVDATVDTSRRTSAPVGQPGDVWELHVSPTLPEGVARDGARYELLGELASGGMATVYLARMVGSMGLSRLVAVKSMHPQYAKDPSFTSMFVDEARLTARLRHPNVVPTLDIVADGGHLLIVMEYVEGESLAALLKLVGEAGEAMPPAIACAILHDALLGLHAAHEARDDDGAPLAIIHRDVSPQNVLVGLDGLARVLDFGVAKARRTVHFSHDGEIKGKVPYMPPEQLFGESIDRRVDVYAAGVLLWEALCGARLYEGPSEEIIVRRIADGVVPAPSARRREIKPELDAVVLRALASNPDERFPSALAMAERIAGAVTLPPRTDVAAWVKRFARVRPQVTTGSRDAATTTDVGALVAGVRRSHGAAGMRHAPRAIVVALAAIAITSATFALVATNRSAQRDASTAAQAAQAIAPEQAVAVFVAPTRASGGSATPPPAGPAVAAAAAVPIPIPIPIPGAVAVAAEAPAKPKPSAPKAATAVAPSPAIVPPTPPESAETADADKRTRCRPPYVLDAEGHRHYKVECL